jgi:hypothetical protein
MKRKLNETFTIVAERNGTFPYTCAGINSLKEAKEIKDKLLKEKNFDGGGRFTGAKIYKEESYHEITEIE